MWSKLHDFVLNLASKNLSEHAHSQHIIVEDYNSLSMSKSILFPEYLSANKLMPFHAINARQKIV